MKRVHALTVACLVLLTAGAAVAGEIPNWAAPPTWSPAISGGWLTKSITSDLSGPLPFIPITPCRLADTRAGSGFPAGYGPPSIAGGGTQRTFTITGQCGIPSAAKAVSFNFAVWGPPTRGDLRVFPAGGATPLVSTLNWEAGILALANAAVVPLGAGGAITLQVDGAGTVDIFFDVNGYYSTTPANASNYFAIYNNSSSYTIFGSNSSTTCTADCGVVGMVNHGDAVNGYSTTGGDGVRGESLDASGSGVHGVLTSNVLLSAAVYGEHKSTGGFGIGVMGTHAGSGYGVYGVSNGTTGSYARGVLGVAFSTADGTVGVEGDSDGATGKSFGVFGYSNSNTTGAAGVKGVDYSGDANGYSGTAGVIGSSITWYGMLATSRYVASKGVLVDGSGTALSTGYFGYNSTNGVYAFGNVGASGLKTFVEPHPSDPTMVIRYAALEGPEAGTYFRGSGETAGGVARIPVPESFRTVTEEEGLTVHITPVGGPGQIWVESRSLDGIVVRSTARNLAFDFIVHGVRRGYRDWEAVVKGTEYVPESPDQKMPVVFSSEIKRRLVANGTYNEDGTVRMDTAQRQGWAQKWDERAKAAAAPRISAAPSNN